MKVSESPYGYTDSYAVKFWYVNAEGYTRQGEEILYTNGKGKHKVVERYFIKVFAKHYKRIDVISVTYQ